MDQLSREQVEMPLNDNPDAMAWASAQAFLLHNKGIGLLWNGPQELALGTIRAALRGEGG